MRIFKVLQFLQEDLSMKYRMYCNQIKNSALFLFALSLAACASTSQKPADKNATDEEGAKKHRKDDINANAYDGREPSSMKGEFTWLNEVEDDFGRIASETSTRAVASGSKHKVLVKENNWAFSYLPKNNQFYLNLQGTQYQMVQTQIDDGERFAFAAKGQAENPITFSVNKGEGRGVASGSTSCTAEISYWNKSAKAYKTERKSVQGKDCTAMITLLKDYVP